MKSIQILYWLYSNFRFEEMVLKPQRLYSARSPNSPQINGVFLFKSVCVGGGGRKQMKPHGL